MLQNRVDPSGDLIRTSARGSWMGNRGLIHDEHQQVQRPFRLTAWLICVLEFKGRKRTVMSPGLYTELFFLDEAAAFSAGHRPCFECRREAANRFKLLWIKGNPEYHFTEKTPIGEIDAILHRERINRRGAKETFRAVLKDIPTGTFVSYEGKAYLVRNGLLYVWSPFGYGAPIDLPEDSRLDVLTPRSTVQAFLMGYVPQITA